MGPEPFFTDRSTEGKAQGEKKRTVVERHHKRKKIPTPVKEKKKTGRNQTEKKSDIRGGEGIRVFCPTSSFFLQCGGTKKLRPREKEGGETNDNPRKGKWVSPGGIVLPRSGKEGGGGQNYALGPGRVKGLISAQRFFQHGSNKLNTQKWEKWGKKKGDGSRETSTVNGVTRLCPRRLTKDEPN